MKLFEERIVKDGVILEGDILKIDSFLNHQIDVTLLDEMGKEFKRLFQDAEVDKILTIESSGIGIAVMAARYFGNCPVETEFFGFLDSDDVVKEDMAYKMLRAIKDNNICMANFTWVYEDGLRKEAFDVGYKDKHEIIEKMFSTLWNKIYRTSWFRNTGIRFPSGLRYEDTSVLIRLAYYMDRVAYVDEAFVDRKYDRDLVYRRT